MQQEGHVVFRHIHVARVDVGHPGHRIQIFNLRAVGIVDDLAVLAVADAEDLVERFAVGKLDDGEIKFAAADKVDDRALIQCAVRRGGDRRSDKRDLDRRIRRLDGFRQLLIALPARSAGEQHQELILLADLNGFRRRDMVRRRIEQARTLQHSGRIR